MLAGLIGAAANVGFFLCPPVVMLMRALGVGLDEGGWRLVLGICAFPALLTFLLRTFVPESERWLHAARSGPRAGLAEIFTPALYRRTLMGAALSGVALIGTWGAVQWIPPWVKGLTEGMPDSQQMTNYAQMCGGLGAVAGALAGAFCGQALGRRPTYFLICLGSLFVCSYLFRWHLEAVSGVVDWRLLAVVFLVGALTASFYGLLPLYLPELFPTRVRATGQGFAYNSGRIVAAAGALTTGLLMQQVFANEFAMATISLVYVAGMVLIWLAPETWGKPLPE